MTIDQDRKYSYLQKLMKVYIRFSKRYTEVEVFKGRDNIIIKYYIPKEGVDFTHEEIEFPIAHIGKRITHYKGKVKKAFTERHDTKKSK